MKKLDYETLTQALDARAQGEGALTFIDGQHDERRLQFRQLRERALCLLGSLCARDLKAGDALVLYLDDNARFVEFFWAALYGGIVPVPIAVGASPAHRDKCLRVWRQMGEPCIVTDARNLQRLQDFATQSDDATAAQRLGGCAVADECSTNTPAEPHTPSPQDTAFIQFSSGSTGEPKGVVLSHANITANLRAISQASDYADDEVALSWMPLTHDMGLIGFHLVMLANGFEHYIMRTDLFARRPLLWLEKAAEKRATLLCSPNFGYRHSLKVISAKGLPQITLGAVRLIYNGAEPIAPALAREFLQALEPTGLRAESMFTVYGLAEASLAVTFPPPGRGLTSLHVMQGRLGVGDAAVLADADVAGATELVCLGSVIPACELRIVDAQNQNLEVDTVGHVQIRGANVTAGYWENVEANSATQTGDGWLDTGDLGFMHAGELVIAGRAKEIIFVNGQNFYPQDIERAAQAVGGVELNKVAAAGARLPGADADLLVLFVLFRGHLGDFVPTAKAVATAINEHTGLLVDRVLPAHRIPKTTSGKLQRGQLAQAYVNGDFDQVAAELDALMQVPDKTANESSGDDTASALKAICREVLPDKPLTGNDNLFEIGLSSLELAQIHEGIDMRWPERIEITDLFDYPTINDLAQFLDGSKK